ncbi:MAG: phospholipid carrier-dependent glycosyltransferase [Acidobacteriaceae bacterium]
MNSLRTAKRFLFPVLGLWVLLYASFSLIKPPLLDGASSVRAEAAREMAVNGGWVTPHVNGAQLVTTSPLLIWSTAASFKLLGVADWTARLPLAFYALALFLLTLTLGARLFFNPVAGFYAALILLTSSGFFLFAHLIYPEILSTLWITLAMYFFWRSLHHKHASFGTVAGFAIACALGVLSRGAAGVIIPVVIVVLFLAITRNLPHLLRWHPVEGVIIFLLISLPWYVAAHGAYSAGRNFSLDSSSHSAPLLLVWAFLLLWIMPWCFFSVAALARRPERVPAYGKQMDPSHQARLLLVLWLIVEALFAILTPRHEFSILPALPALALLAAGWLAADEISPARLGKIFAWVFVAAGVILAAAAIFFGARAPFASSGVDIATLLHLHPGQHRLFFGHLTDFTRSSMGAFRIPLFIAAAALLAGTIVNLFFRIRRQARMANCFLVGMMAFLLMAGHIALNTFAPVVSSAVLAEAIKPEMNPGDVVVVNGHYADASALGFYLEQPIHLLGASSHRRNGFAPSVFEQPSALATQWSGPGRVFLWTTSQSAPSLPGEVYLIARNGGREILSNQPDAGGASF